MKWRLGEGRSQKLSVSQQDRAKSLVEGYGRWIGHRPACFTHSSLAWVEELLRSRPASKPAKQSKVQCSAAVYAQSPTNDRRGTRLFGLQGAVWIRPSAGTPGIGRYGSGRYLYN